MFKGNIDSIRCTNHEFPFEKSWICSLLIIYDGQMVACHPQAVVELSSKMQHVGFIRANGTTWTLWANNEHRISLDFLICLQLFLHYFMVNYACQMIASMENDAHIKKASTLHNECRFPIPQTVLSENGCSCQRNWKKMMNSIIAM